MTMSVRTTKVCFEALSLPDGVEVISAAVSGGHLSSASIYPACYAPYQFVTACSDGEVRFWRCNLAKLDESQGELSTSTVTSYEFSMDESNMKVQPQVQSKKESMRKEHLYSWSEWQLTTSSTNKSSSVSVSGKPIAISCAYSGRLAVAFRLGPIRKQPENPDNKLVNLRVVILECESTGGSEWIQEDTIELNNIKIPDPKHEIDMLTLNSLDSPQLIDLDHSTVQAAFLTRTKSVPSLSTIMSVRKSISEAGNKKGLLRQKCLVQLDWVSTEDGSHLLTVGVGSKVLIYGQVSYEIAKSLKSLNQQAEASNEDKRSAFANSKRLAVNKSMVAEDYQEEIKWMQLKGIELSTADGLPPLPMHINWVRAGILVVGMDNEMQVFTQWKPDNESIEAVEEDPAADSRTLTEAKLVTAASSLNLCSNFKSKSNFKTSFSMSNFKHISNIGLQPATSKRESVKKINQPSSGVRTNQARSESISSLPMLYDTGLFEAARFANPVLPQYHPKLLMELLNFGKTKRVKAILAHLVRCISCSDGVHSIYSEEHLDNGHLSVKLTRQRSISVRSDNDGKEAETSVNYVEIKSIPPLPLYALIAADKDTASIHTSTKGVHSTKDKDYSEILDVNIQNTEDDLDEQLLSTSADSTDSTPRRPRLLSSGNKPPTDPYSFSPAQASVLREYLFKLNLPGLSGNDQFYLAALAEVVGSTALDFQDIHDGETNKEHQGSVDECGLRFLLAIRQYQCLVKTLPPIQRVSLLENGIRTFHLVWAFHSESTQELLSAIPCVKADEPVWDELKLYGVGWWLNNMTHLKALMVKVANTAFKKSKKPMDAALYYLAMKKRTIVKSLFKTVQDSKMEAFFNQDFSNENNCRVAMKNAFHLLSKGQYHHAAALFFLAGKVENAVNVILDKLEDLQLAIVLCRLYDDTLLADSVRQLFYEKILGLDKDGRNYQSKLANPDPFLRSMALWQFKDYESSLQTLLEKNIGTSYPQPHGDMDKLLQITRVFNFYNYLRTHPLITRLRLASSSLKQRTELITGFTHTDTVVSDGITTLDQITPSERQLFFATAHAHFQNGCPLVSIEVMRKLPKCPLLVQEDLQKMEYFANRRRMSMCEINSTTGTLEDLNIMSLNKTSPGDSATNNKSTSSNKADSVDWGQPLLNSTSQTASSFDWGFSNHVRFKDELDLELDLDLGGSDDDEENADEEVNKNTSVEVESSGKKQTGTDEKQDDVNQIDIMAQQYKFISCLKVLSEELGNLATGFEVDGGQLRHQLYIWLEKEVEVLRVLCNYGSSLDSSTYPVPPENESILDDSEETSDAFQRNARTMSMRSDTSLGKASLYEVMKAEKQDLQSKVARMIRRKAWLRSNQHLLRTLASYCILQGSGGGGLASVRMEILLLLQELQQEKPQQQLLSPLPFPTTLPLLSASITSNRSVIADPIQYLQCSIQDLLLAVVEMLLPPGTQTDIGFVSTIRDLAVALSSCIYQSLCDSDSFNVDAAEVGIDGFINPEFSYPSSHLMAGVKRYRQRSLSSIEEVVNTTAAKWPGVPSLQVLLARERDEDAPKINVMLIESLIAVYMSLLISALSMYDPQIIYRLVANKLDGKTWAALFGGGNKTPIKTDKVIPRPQEKVSKHIMMLNFKVMGNASVSSSSPNALPETKVSYKEKFIAPELSMVNYFMTKPFVASADAILDYESDDSLGSDDEVLSSDEDEDQDDTSSIKKKKSLLKKKVNTEHSDPNSYSWCLIRYSVIKSVINNLAVFFPQIGTELSELPNASPNLHAVIKVVEQWEEILQSQLDAFGGAPENYIPGLFSDLNTIQGRSKYEALLQPNNTPFDSIRATLPIKRLWFYLLQQDKLKDIFIRYVYRKRKELEDSEMGSMRTSSSDYEHQVKEPMKIIHKEQDIITSFAINQANNKLITLSTQKEIVELDIGYLLHPPVWLEDENEYDIEMLRKIFPNPGPENPEFLVVQTPMDTIQPSSGGQTPSTSYMPSPSSSQFNLQTGRGSTVITRRPVMGVRRIGSHPTLPHYLTGGADGAVKLWEWGHNQPLATLRQSGSFPKVTKVLFNAQGNKCCVSDVEGSIALWQVGLGSNHSKPIMGLQCHNKTTSDFQFVGSSSLIATAGQSSEHKNVCIWDTLLPQRSSLVHAFQCHEQGSPAVVYASRQHLLISGGRKGEICIFDLRQRVLKHTFQAHEAPIKCLAIDPDEDYFITGSADGDIKVWGLKIHQLIFSFPMEHSKNTFFKNVGSTSGVAQVHVGPLNHLFSCGVDGSMKFRQLPERELVVHHWA